MMKPVPQIRRWLTAIQSSKILLLHERQPANGRLNPGPPTLPSKEHHYGHWPYYIRHQRLCVFFADTSESRGQLS